MCPRRIAQHVALHPPYAQAQWDALHSDPDAKWEFNANGDYEYMQKLPNKLVTSRGRDVHRGLQLRNSERTSADAEEAATKRMRSLLPLPAGSDPMQATRGDIFHVATADVLASASSAPTALSNVANPEHDALRQLQAGQGLERRQGLDRGVHRRHRQA